MADYATWILVGLPVLTVGLFALLSTLGVGPSIATILAALPGLAVLCHALFVRGPREESPT